MTAQTTKTVDFHGSVAPVSRHRRAACLAVVVSSSGRRGRSARAVGSSRPSSPGRPRARGRRSRARRTRRPGPRSAAPPDGDGGPHPGRRVLVLARAPVLPRQVLGLAVVVDEQLVLGVDRVLAVGERELEQLGLGDGLGRAGLDAQVAVDAPQVVDLVDEAVALARARPGRRPGCRRRARRCSGPGTRRRTARSRCTSPCRPRSG